MFLNTEAFLRLVKERRKSENLSLRALAELSGVSYSAISRMEGGRFTPTYDNAVRLAKALGIMPTDVPAHSYSEHEAGSRPGEIVAHHKLVTEGEVKRQTIASGRRKNLSKLSTKFDCAMLIEGTLILQSAPEQKLKVSTGAKLDCHLLRQHTYWALAMSDIVIVWFRAL